MRSFIVDRSLEIFTNATLCEPLYDENRSNGLDLRASDKEVSQPACPRTRCSRENIVNDDLLDIPPPLPPRPSGPSMRPQCLQIPMPVVHRIRFLPRFWESKRSNWEKLMIQAVTHPYTESQLHVHDTCRKNRETEIWKHLGGWSPLKLPLFHLLLNHAVQRGPWDDLIELKRLPCHVRAVFFPSAESTFFYSNIMNEPLVKDGEHTPCPEERFQNWFEGLPDDQKAINLFHFLENVIQIYGASHMDTYMVTVLQRPKEPLLGTLIENCPSQDIIHLITTFIESSQISPSLLDDTQQARMMALNPALNTFSRIVRSTSSKWKPLRLFRKCMESLRGSTRFLALWFFVAAQLTEPRPLIRVMLRKIPGQDKKEQLMSQWWFFLWYRWIEIGRKGFCPYFGPPYLALKMYFGATLRPPNVLGEGFIKWVVVEAQNSRNGIDIEYFRRAKHSRRN